MSARIILFRKAPSPVLHRTPTIAKVRDECHLIHGGAWTKGKQWAEINV